MNSEERCGFTMSFLFSIDKAVFIFLNHSLANPVFDVIMPFVTEANHWKIPLFLAWLSLMIFGGKKGRIAGLLAVVIVTMSDQLSSAVIKPWVRRLRPCDPKAIVEGGRFLIGLKESFSFPSSHAANNAAIATLFSVKYRRYTAVFIAIAATVAYSRIYVGVHYPSDVLGGIFVGVLCATCILGIERGVQVLWRIKKERDIKKPKEDSTEKA